MIGMFFAAMPESGKPKCRLLRYHIHSRMHRFVYSKGRTRDELLSCWLAAISFYGGMPEEWVTDNMSAIVTFDGRRRVKSDRVLRFATNPNQPTHRRLWSRGCDGFANSRSCRALPAAFDAGSRCRLQPRSAARGAGPRRSSLLSRRKNTKGADRLDYWLNLQFFALPMALRTAYCASESRLPL